MGRTDAPLPEAIGRFTIQQVLGRGGMGEVYKAFDPTLQRTVAVKTVRPDIDRPEYLDRMMREAQACARLSHPNIVTVYEAGKSDGVVFIAMEYLQGQNLADVLQTTTLSFERKVGILAKVLEALHHAHGLDVVHRDVKPGNIHLCTDGTIKLMDFGLARVLVADTLTASGNVLGTPHYASPEQLKGESVDRRTDIYSTGVMAYEMFAGRRPFEPDNDSISSVIIKVIQQPAAPMDTDMSRMLPEIESIVSRAMAKAPSDRYQSADEMRRALVNFLEHSHERITAIESQGTSTVITPVPPPLSSTNTIPKAAAPARSAPSAIPEFAAPAPSRRVWYVSGAAAAVLVGALLIAAPSRQMEETAPSTVAAVPTATIAAAQPPDSNPVPAAPAPAAITAAANTPATSTASPSAAATIPPPAAGGVAISRSNEMLSTFNGKDAQDLWLDNLNNNSNPQMGLAFRILQAGPGNTPVRVDHTKEFKTGDRIRLQFVTTADGYLYVAQQGSSGNWTVLYPNPDINGGRNAVKRLAEITVPENDWFELAPPAGAEQLFVFLTKEPLTTLPGFERPVKSFEAGSATMIAELRSSIQPRDLVFKKDPGAAGSPVFIVNKTELSKSVTGSFTLTHK